MIPNPNNPYGGQRYQNLQKSNFQNPKPQFIQDQQTMLNYQDYQINKNKGNMSNPNISFDNESKVSKTPSIQCGNKMNSSPGVQFIFNVFNNNINSSR
jgi:hypothetical protein